MLAVTDLGHGFQDGTGFRWLFENLSFNFHPGKSTNLWGPSGSGKTTLLNILAGLQQPLRGRATFTAGQRYELHDATEKQLLKYRRHHVGFIYQFFNLIPTLTVLENVELPLELTAQTARRPDALTMLHEFNLQHLSESFPSTLSGGEQQRVAIARALIHRPSVVLADEPTGNLDQANAKHVIDCLFDTAGAMGAILVLASHDPMVKERADYVLDFTTLRTDA